MSLEVRNKLHFSGIPPIFTLFFCFFFKPSSLTGFSLEGCVSCLQLPYKIPHTGWVKTAEIRVPLVLESRSPRLTYRQAVSLEPLSLASGGLPSCCPVVTCFPSAFLPLWVLSLIRAPVVLQRSRYQFDSWVGKIPWRWDRLPYSSILGLLAGDSDSKESACNVGDLGLIPGLGRSPGGRHGNPIQYSCLENPHGYPPKPVSAYFIALCSHL